MSRTNWLRTAAAGLLPIALFLGSTNAQERREEKTGAHAHHPSLPAYWGHLDLTESQRERYYETATKHRGRIEELEHQLEKLKAERHHAYLEILTPVQKRKLDEILAEKGHRGQDHDEHWETKDGKPVEHDDHSAAKGESRRKEPRRPSTKKESEELPEKKTHSKEDARKKTKTPADPE